MQRRLRIDSPETPPAVRQIIGLHVSADCREVRAAPLLAFGNGLHLNVRVGRAVSVQLPARAGDLFASLRGLETTTPGAVVSWLAELRTLVTENTAIAAHDAAASNSKVLSESIAIGIVEPGIWNGPADAGVSHFSIIDAALLANLSGVNVVDGFPARDIACGGRGGPLSPLAEWILFRSPHCPRILVNLGRATRITRLPKLNGSLSSISGLLHRVLPGMALVDLLVEQLTAGKRHFDPGGRFSVQGRRISELVDLWQDATRSPEYPTQWAPVWPPVTGLLKAAVRAAVEKNWSIYDMLCSATHLVAELAAVGSAELAGPPGAAEIILAGNGLSSGLLLRALTAELGKHHVRRVKDLGLDSDALAPAAAAILALLHLDQVPANVAGLTGAEVPRVLGRLTPGGPQAWQRLLAACAKGSSNIRPLRAAL